MSDDQLVALAESMPAVGAEDEEEEEGASQLLESTGRRELSKGGSGKRVGGREVIKRGTWEAPACRCSQSGYKVPMIPSRLGCVDKAGLAGDSRAIRYGWELRATSVLGGGGKEER